MKTEFQVMTKSSLQEYFLTKFLNEYNNTQLKNSRKSDLDLSLREHLGLVILSYFFQLIDKESIYRPACKNDDYDDGAICDINKNVFIPVEQVYVYEDKYDQNAEEGIRSALKIKDKGSEYSKGLTLVIFCNAEGDISISSLESDIKASNFEFILIIGPTGEGEFDYNIVNAKESGNTLTQSFRMVIDRNTGIAKLVN